MVSNWRQPGKLCLIALLKSELTLAVPYLQVSQIRAGMSQPLLALALDRTPLQPLQLMSGVLPLPLVLQVSG